VLHTVYVHSPARVPARAWLKHSIISGQIRFKFAAHILQMTTSYMGCILIMFTHRVYASGHACASGVCERPCVSARMIKRSIFELILEILWGHTTDPHRLHELFKLCVNACPNSAHQYTHESAKPMTGND
jgi:hypothetical protein